MKYSEKLWSGEAAKIRRRVRASAERNVKAKAGESRLGQAWRRIGRVDGEDVDAQIAIYAEAMGITIQDAAHRVENQHEHLHACGQPLQR